MHSLESANPAVKDGVGGVQVGFMKEAFITHKRYSRIVC